MGKASPSRSLTLLHYVLPITQWLPAYKWKQNVRLDVLAGLTVSAMSVAQGMAYALIVGVHPVYGLYTSLIPGVVYTFFGSSPQLIVGPTAVLSLLASSGLTINADDMRSTDQLMIISAASGIVQIILGLLHLGTLTNFLALPVVSGFTSAAGIIIAIQQLKGALGLHLKQSDRIYNVIIDLFHKIGDTHLYTLLITCVSLLMILITKKVRALKWVPIALVLVVLGIIISYAAHVSSVGVAIVGEIPTGVPKPKPILAGDIAALIPKSIIVALVSILEAVSISRTFAVLNKYEVNANQDLLALGVSNFVGAWFKCFPATGSFSRTAVNSNLKAKSPLSNLIAASMVFISLLLLTHVFSYVPKAVLSAIIIAAALGLVDYDYALVLFKSDYYDFAVFVLSFLATLALGIELGIGIAVGSSLLILAVRTALTPVVTLVYLEDLKMYVNSESLNKSGQCEPGASQPQRFSYPETDGVLALQFQGALSFANGDLFRSKIIKALDVAEERISHSQIHTIVLDMSMVTDFDHSGLHALERLLEDLQLRQTRLCLAAPIPKILQKLQHHQFLIKLGDEMIKHTVEQAIDHCSRHPPIPLNGIITTDGSGLVGDVNDETPLLRNRVN